MTKPEALLLADELIWWDFAIIRGRAAAELRRLHTENALLHERHSNDNHEYMRVLAQRDALLEALKEYGWHDEACPQYPTYAHPERWPACTCGFDAAIAAAEGEKK